MIQTQCAGCFREYKLDDRFAGKTIRCKDCGTPFKVTSAAAAVPSFDEPFEEEQPAAAPPARKSGGRKSVGKKRARAASNSKAWIWWTVGGGVLAMLLLCGGGIWLAVSAVRSGLQAASTPELDLGDPNQLFPLADVPLPQFPELGAPRPLDSGVQQYFVDFDSIRRGTDAPGMRMKMRVYIPPGDHAPASLPCVLVAPAGTNLMVGNEMDNDDYHDETLPYALAGMVCIFYSLDGGVYDLEGASDDQFREGYLKFRAARAGVVNGRNALEFALAKLPQVDPQRIFSAGHSSAGTFSLLFAAHEPRLRGCIAYAPATDVELRLAEVAEAPVFNLLLPGITDFLRQSSPKTHAERINCPVFLFHARDDSNEPFETTEAFAAQLASLNKPHTFSPADWGDHYESMIDEGIPRGIEWIQTQTAGSP